jgi:hypothetical protein
MNSLCNECVWRGQKFLPVVRLLPAESGSYPTESVIQELQDESTKWCTLQEWVKLGCAAMQLKEEDPARRFTKERNNTLPFPTALRDSTSNLSTFRNCTKLRHLKGSLSSYTTCVLQSEGEGMCRGGDGA